MNLLQNFNKKHNANDRTKIYAFEIKCTMIIQGTLNKI